MTTEIPVKVVSSSGQPELHSAPVKQAVKPRDKGVSSAHDLLRPFSASEWGPWRDPDGLLRSSAGGDDTYKDS